jgi:hypothetical protein
VGVNNYAEDKDGNAVGGALCAYQDRQTASKLNVAPCFLPKAAAGPYWVVAYNETAGYALISGGQPTILSTTGGCRTGDGINNSGLWIFTRSPLRDETLIQKVRSIAKGKGFDLTVLNDVVQVGCYDEPVVVNKPTSSFCFSGETTVEVKGKGTLFMKELNVGDEVLSETGIYESVYSFGHRHETLEASFLQFLPSTIEISRDHMLKIDSRYIPASAVQVGDKLETGTGEYLTVESIHTVVRKGVYAPFTMSGTIVVSNIKSSSYIAFQDSDGFVVGGWKTPLSFQWLAHGSQSPHRTWVRLFGAKNEAYSDMGMSSWVVGPHLLCSWYMEQSSAVMILLLIPALMCLLVFSTFEVVLSWVIYSK